MVALAKKHDHRRIGVAGISLRQISKSHKHQRMGKPCRIAGALLWHMALGNRLVKGGWGAGRAQLAHGGASDGDWAVSLLL